MISVRLVDVDSRQTFPQSPGRKAISACDIEEVFSTSNIKRIDLKETFDAFGNN